MQNVVWEKLDDLMGNTQFLKADFTPYGSTSLAEQASDAADLVQAAFAGVGPPSSHSATGVPLSAIHWQPSHAVLAPVSSHVQSACDVVWSTVILPCTHPGCTEDVQGGLLCCSASS